MAEQRNPNSAKGRKMERPPTFKGWLTTDEQEVERRRWRGRTDVHEFENLGPGPDVFGNFRVGGTAGRSYTVEIRDLRERSNSCTCQDFATSGLGTCKHIEGVLHRLAESGAFQVNRATNAESPRIEVHIVDGAEPEPSVRSPGSGVSERLAAEAEGLVAALRSGTGSEPMQRLRQLADKYPERLRVSCLVDRWAARREHKREREERREFVLREIAEGRLRVDQLKYCLLYTSPSPRDGLLSRMPSSA